MPSPQLADDRLIVRYLLGLLPDEEAEPIEEASVIDADFALRVRSVEDDLVDGYVSQTLDAATQARFESFYLASARRRDRVAFAHRFLAAIDQAANATASPGMYSPVLPMRAARMTRLRSLTVAAVLVLACAGMATSLVSRREARQATAIAATRGGLPGAPQTPSAIEPIRREPEALVLSPQTRGIESLPSVDLTPHTDRLAIRLLLEVQDYEAYRVSLFDAARRLAWRSDRVVPQRAAERTSLVLAVAADKLGSGPHTFEVSGLGGRGHAEPVASYTFAVRRR